MDKTKNNGFLFIHLCRCFSTPLIHTQCGNIFHSFINIMNAPSHIYIRTDEDIYYTTFTFFFIYMKREMAFKASNYVQMRSILFNVHYASFNVVLCSIWTRCCFFLLFPLMIQTVSLNGIVKNIRKLRKVSVKFMQEIKLFATDAIKMYDERWMNFLSFVIQKMVYWLANSFIYFHPIQIDLKFYYHVKFQFKLMPFTVS